MVVARSGVNANTTEEVIPIRVCANSRTTVAGFWKMATYGNMAALKPPATFSSSPTFRFTWPNKAVSTMPAYRVGFVTGGVLNKLANRAERRIMPPTMRKVYASPVVWSAIWSTGEIMKAPNPEPAVAIPEAMPRRLQINYKYIVKYSSPIIHFISSEKTFFTY